MSDNKPVVEWIEMQIDASRRNLESAKHAVQAAEKELRMVEERHNMLIDLRNKAGTTQVEMDGIKRGQVQGAASVEVAVGPTEAIRDLLRDRPGLKASEIVREIIDKVETSSKDPRKMLFNVINTLQNRNKIIKDKKGRLYLPPTS
jgi:hypothetical protein